MSCSYVRTNLRLSVAWIELIHDGSLATLALTQALIKKNSHSHGHIQTLGRSLHRNSPGHVGGFEFVITKPRRFRSHDKGGRPKPINFRVSLVRGRTRADCLNRFRATPFDDL